MLTSIISLVFSVSVFIFLIWFRFIRERLPSIIPYEMSLFGIILLSLTCLAYANSIYLILFPPKAKAFTDLFKNFRRIVQKPYDILCNHLYEGKRTRRYFITFVNYMIYKCNASPYYKIFATFELCIRLLISLSLFVDIFWFGCLYYFYKCLLLNMFLFLFSMFRYVLIFTKSKNINYMDERTQLFCQPYKGATGVVEAELVLNELFLHDLNNKPRFLYTPIYNPNYVRELIKRDNIPAHLTLDANEHQRRVYGVMDVCILITKFLYYLEIEYKKYKYAYLALYCFAFFCWCSLFYFNLQVTSHLNIIEQINSIIKIIQIPGCPFI